MDSTRRIIAALLAIACITQSLIPCRCRLPPCACGAECRESIAAVDRQAVACRRRCSHSHYEHFHSTQVENGSPARQQDVPAPAPTREKCPHCLCQYWVALPNSFSREMHQHCLADAILNVRAQATQFTTHAEPSGGSSNRAIVFSQVRLPCRIQI